MPEEKNNRLRLNALECCLELASAFQFGKVVVMAAITDWNTVVSSYNPDSDLIVGTALIAGAGLYRLGRIYGENQPLLGQ